MDLHSNFATVALVDLVMTGQSAMVLSLIIIAAILYLLVMERRNRSKQTAIYVDHNRNNTVFYSTRYAISAKPDAITGPTTIEEMKSRRRGIYASDRAQMIATALAVRSTYPITRGILVTTEKRYDVSLAGTDEALFEQLTDEYAQATLIANGIAPTANPSPGKCRVCEYQTLCEYRA